jgi:hypothetical protein
MFYMEGSLGLAALAAADGDDHRAAVGSGRWEAASTGARSLSADSAIALALEPALLPG